MTDAREAPERDSAIDILTRKDVIPAHEGKTKWLGTYALVAPAIVLSVEERDAVLAELRNATQELAAKDRAIEAALNEHEPCRILMARIEELKQDRDARRWLRRWMGRDR